MASELLSSAGSRHRGAVLVVHSWWGLTRSFRDFGRALAARGFAVGLADLFDGRTAETPAEARWLRAAPHPSQQPTRRYQPVQNARRGKLCWNGSMVRRVVVKPSAALDRKRDAVREAASRFRAANPRVFGSALHGTDEDGSDLDLLVDALPGATLFDLGGLQIELEELRGVPVDLLTPGDLTPKVRDRVLAEARPV